MSKTCARTTTGGKGNVGMFIERDPKVCAAGVLSLQSEDSVAANLKQYMLQDEVDALFSDAIYPPPKARPQFPLRHPIPRDMRNAGPFNQANELITPPKKTKFQTLVEDLKNTTYSSYWKKQVGKSCDPTPALPENFDIYGTTLGKKTPFYGRLYDIVMPIDPVFDETPTSKRPGYQQGRNYCKPPFKPNQIFGLKYNFDPRGIQMKCCLTDDRIPMGVSLRNPVNNIQADFKDANQAQLGVCLEPNHNIRCVPDGYSFGNLKPSDNFPECLTSCELNPDRELFKKCLGHLNLLRKCLSNRFDGYSFFHGFYLNLKCFDESKTGWLPKDRVYKFCASKYIRFDSSLIEPLLSTWNAFDGYRIEYKTFVRVINFREPTPYIPKVLDIPEDCIDFRTTYTEMVKPRQEPDTKLMAGIPSGRYLDMNYPVTPKGCCKADNSYLPQESDVKACLCPSILTILGISHRDMYMKREPCVIRKVFEAVGEKFTDDEFDYYWNEAKKYHSQGWVCYETFRRVLNFSDKNIYRGA